MIWRFAFICDLNPADNVGKFFSVTGQNLPDCNIGVCYQFTKGKRIFKTQKGDDVGDCVHPSLHSRLRLPKSITFSDADVEEFWQSAITQRLRFLTDDIQKMGMALNLILQSVDETIEQRINLIVHSYYSFLL